MTNIDLTNSATVRLIADALEVMGGVEWDGLYGFHSFRFWVSRDCLLVQERFNEDPLDSWGQDEQLAAESDLHHFIVAGLEWLQNSDAWPDLFFDHPKKQWAVSYADDNGEIQKVHTPTIAEAVAKAVVAAGKEK